MKPHCKSPCKACPFRRASMPGYLGSSSPERFALAILCESPLPCHETIDYNDRRWLRKWLDGKTGKLCAGALTLSRNMGKMPRGRGVPRFEPDRENVFGSLVQFITHHRSSSIVSWDENEDRRGLRAWATLVNGGIHAASILAEMDGEGGADV